MTFFCLYLGIGRPHGALVGHLVTLILVIWQFRIGKGWVAIFSHGQSRWHSPQKVGWYRAYINQYMVSVPSTFTLVYWLFHRTQPVLILCPAIGCHSLEMKPANEALYFGEKDEGNSRFGDPESSYSVWCWFLGCLFPEVMEKKSSNHVFFMGKIMLKHPCGSNELNLFVRSPTCQICWRRASATAVVAVVFLADRLNKHMIHSPGRWTCAGCNALAALLCDMVFQNNDSVGSYWKIWNIYIYVHIFFPRNKQLSPWISHHFNMSFSSLTGWTGCCSSTTMMTKSRWLEGSDLKLRDAWSI